jgi:hypothetical protein
MRRRSLTAGALLVSMLFAQSAAATRPRPDAIQPNDVYTDLAPNALAVFNDYATPSRTYSSSRSVVHYVTSGLDAPPLNDDDADGVPDYVERVAEAADVSIRYYERRGFAAIAPDTGGPDASPDIYISRFAPGYFGVAFPAAIADGGAFVAVANGLDPSPARSLGSVYGTVAHELFHLVQFSSSARGPGLPAWALEGMAAAMENRVFRGLDDIVAMIQLRGWFAAPQRGFTAQSYGSQLLWRFLDIETPRLLPAFLHAARGSAAASLAASYEKLTGAPFGNAFHRFAVWAQTSYSGYLKPLATVRRRAEGAVAPLAVHYLRIARDVRSISIRLSHRRGTASLVYQRTRRPGLPPLTRRLPRHSATWSIPRGGTATLIVSNGQTTGTVNYRVVGAS